MPRLLLSIACALAILLTAAPAARALDLTGLRIGAHPDKTRIVLEMSEPAQFRVQILDNPARLVVDMPGFDWTIGSFPKPKGSRIREVHQGALNDSASRVAFDLDRPMAIAAVQTIPRSKLLPARLVIDIAPADDAAFRTALTKHYGSFTPGDTKDMPAKIEPVSATATKLPAPAKRPQLDKEQPTPEAEKPIIVIDAGHGGEDPGASGPQGLHEKDINFATAKVLRRQLEATGKYRVLMTRDRDVFVRLGDRVAFARAHGANLFISIHSDSISQPATHGATVYTLSEKASDAESEKLAARENQADKIAGLDLSKQDADVANILVDLAMRDTMNQSKFFARKTVAMLKTGGISVMENPHRFAGFAVLKAPDIPSVLIEIGYMSNPKESVLLATPEYENKIAAAIAMGVDDYFDTVNRNASH